MSAPTAEPAPPPPPEETAAPAALRVAADRQGHGRGDRAGAGRRRGPDHLQRRRRVIESLSVLLLLPVGLLQRAGRRGRGRRTGRCSTARSGRGTRSARTLERAAPLICAGLGVTLAFRAGLFNIGAQGQLIVGAIGAAYVGFTWDLPPGLHLLVALVAGLARRALGRHRRLPQGPHRCPRGDHHDHAQLPRPVPCCSTASPRRPSSGRAATTRSRRRSTDSATFPELVGVHLGVVVALARRARRLVAPRAQHHRLRDARRRCQRSAARTAGMSVAEGLHPGHGHRRRAGRPGGGHEHPRPRRHPEPDDRRHASASTRSPSPCSAGPPRSARCSPACCSAP